MKRSEHLKWAKDRALKIIEDTNNTTEAWASFTSDMNKHDELNDHPALMMGMMMLMNGAFNAPTECIKFIEGFN